MRIIVDKDSLLKSVIIADSIITSKNVNTILSNCLFNVSKDEIEIISTDNEIGIRTKVKAVSDGKDSFTINGKRLVGILKEIPKGDVEIGINDSYQVDILNKNIKGHYSLIGASRGEYPDMPAFNDDRSVELDQSILKEMIRKVIYAASVDSIKPAFNGVYFISEESGKITAVATDSKRLSMSTIKLDNSIKIDDGVIIPLKTINELQRILSASGKCRFIAGKNQCFFKIGDTEIASRVIDGQFPNYKLVIPHDYKIKISFQKTRLLDSLRRMLVLTKEPYHKILLNFRGDNLLIEAKTQEYGEAEEEIPVENNSKAEMVIGISAHYLMDAIKEIESNDISFGITSPVSPIVITSEGNEGDVSIIMPIQIKSSNTD
jgi:DNA polymerase III subunit beta